ncbi:hypothetical protein [Streptomyces pseudovenezuelae]|uniref:Uncharacterized protein n=1 Tax=Streptomyces pseudovenezuelae TaxID=67350 RepID=A0ABT6LHY8_9ACTN|nr:hypothetical protein [Streptomyces pseudovenezuelae]MDH6215231.1 hypothetical protein [Streptomyces pseudovenezuelae]
MNLFLSSVAALLALVALFSMLKPPVEPPPQAPSAERPADPELPVAARPFTPTGLGGPWPPVTFCCGRCDLPPLPYATGPLRVTPAPP